MKKKINLLITCVGGGLMPELLIHLKKSPKYDFKIIGTDKNYQTNSKHFCDKFYQTPDGSDEKKWIWKTSLRSFRNNFCKTESPKSFKFISCSWIFFIECFSSFF